jgi:hypothetical protein
MAIEKKSGSTMSSSARSAEDLAEASRRLNVIDEGLTGSAKKAGEALNKNSDFLKENMENAKEASSTFD